MSRENGEENLPGDAARIFMVPPSTPFLTGLMEDSDLLTKLNAYGNIFSQLHSVSSRHSAVSTRRHRHQHRHHARHTIYICMNEANATEQPGSAARDTGIGMIHSDVGMYI